jgi:hypothetical protein
MDYVKSSRSALLESMGDSIGIDYLVVVGGYLMDLTCSKR